MRPSTRSSNHGNVLFLILIAVALFAALSYAVTQSSNPAGNNASKEQAELIAAQIVQSAAGIKFAYDRLNISGRYDQIHFDDSADNPAGIVYVGSNATATGRTIGIFNSASGLTIPNIPEAAFTASVNDAAFIYSAIEIDTDGDGTSEFDLGTSGSDIVLRYAFLTEEVCRAINRRLGIGDVFAPFSIPTDSSGFTFIRHDFLTSAFNIGAVGSIILTAPMPACVQEVGNPTNTEFFYVIDSK